MAVVVAVPKAAVADRVAAVVGHAAAEAAVAMEAVVRLALVNFPFSSYSYPEPALKEQALFWCAEHVRQLGGASPLHNVMDVK
jgi:hypothetical protein